MMASMESVASASASAEVSVVVPLHNEEAILDTSLTTLAAFFDRVIGPRKWLFLLVENGSTDRTPNLVEAALARYPLARAIHLVEPNYGGALKAGVEAATTRWVYLIDVEQWDLPFIVWAWRNRERYDVLLGSKRADATINHQPPYRRLLSCALNGILQVLFQYTGTDTHGAKLLDRGSLKPIIDLCRLDRGQYDTELVLRAMRSGKRLVEVPVYYRDLRPPRNSMIKKIVWNILALRQLMHVMKDVPFESYSRYYRFAREDVLTASRDLAVGEEVSERA
jgi:glycosyltransferase involved in cell wall biosynthesis